LFCAMSSSDMTLLWAPAAWLDGRWQTSVLLAADAAGRWQSIEAGRSAPERATRLAGPALPGLVNAHSHAFQRAFVGRAERRAGAHDDFWSWRDRMYGVALTITPDALRELATGLYRELLAGGYTQVCEFHYLHHAEDGSRYADALAMSRALADAAVAAGIGLTLLPVLYEFPPEMQQDQAKPWRDPANWPMVSPNLGRSISMERLVAAFQDEEQKGEGQLRLWASQHLNVEIGLALMSDRWAGADYWEQQGTAGLTLDELQGPTSS